jgi:hypothetical protein
VLQAMHGLSLAQTEFLVADRLSWMRFCGLGPGDGSTGGVCPHEAKRTRRRGFRS